MSSTEVRNFFEEINETSEGFRTRCPNCGEKDKSLAWNETDGVGCCFHQHCDWYYQKGGVSEKELKEFFGDKSVYTKVLKPAEIGDPKLPEEFELLKNLRPGLKEAVTEYLVGRGLEKKILYRYKVGYCSTGRFWGYIILPIIVDDEIVYWQARRFKKRSPKFYNPTSTRKTEWLYQVGNPKRPRGAVIVESVINALTLSSVEEAGWPIYVLLGKTISDHQIMRMMLHQKTLREVVIALDGDAIKEAAELARKLSGIFRGVKIATIPDGEDINSLGRSKAWDRIYSAEPYKREEHFSWSLRTA